VKRSVPGKKLRKNTVTGKEVKESTLGRVPNAAKLNGQPASAFATAQPIERRVVGAPGEPPFENGWSASPTDFGPPTFGKDQFGFVHLEGAAVHSGASTETIFTLPAGYRPASGLDEDFAVAAFAGNAGTLEVGRGGAVSFVGTGYPFVSLNGVSFRAG
jgi:hypothetical protein